MNVAGGVGEGHTSAVQEGESGSGVVPAFGNDEGVDDGVEEGSGRGGAGGENVSAARAGKGPPDLGTAVDRRRGPVKEGRCGGGGEKIAEEVVD